MSAYPNLRHARLYCACLAHGSVTRAAEAVGVSQPAASQALNRLGLIFGASLIDTVGGQLAATAEGRIVAARLSRALDFIHAGCARLRLARNAAALAALENRLTLSHLRALAAFAETGGFSAAARWLDQSEPAVHKMARGMEEALAVALFEGKGRAIRLSRTGTAVARWARLALNEFDSADAELAERRGTLDGHVAIGALPLARTSLVPDAVTRVAAAHPYARFSIAEGRYADLLRELEMGRIDLLVGALRPEFSAPSLEQEDLFSYRLSVVARAGHPLCHRADLSPADLAAYPFVVARPDTPSRDMFEQLARRFPPDRPARRSVEVGSLVAIRGLLNNSDHLALLSTHQIAYEMKSDCLQPLAFDLGEPDHVIGLTRRRHWQPTELQARFIAALRAAARSAGEG